MMNAEKLKVIAVGMGYVIFCPENTSERFTVWDGKNIHTRQKYKPDTTNNDQMAEIMETLQIDIEYMNCIEFTGVMASICRKGYEYEGRGKTLNEAVCNVAYEDFK